jgi:hypothetical protein
VLQPDPARSTGKPKLPIKSPFSSFELISGYSGNNYNSNGINSIKRALKSLNMAVLTCYLEIWTKLKIDIEFSNSI